MKLTIFAIACLCALAAASTAVQAQGVPSDAEKRAYEAAQALPWKSAPDIGRISSIAAIKLTGDLRFLDATNTSRFLELNGNPPRPNNYTLAPTSISWFAVFSFDATGYVKDDEKIDADKLLEILKEQNRIGIDERRRLNLPVLHLDGWFVAPHYDAATRRLEWGTKLRGDDGTITVNYSIRLLGRRGVMSAVLVSEPSQLEADIRSFKAALASFEFVSGEKYAEYRDGDKIAEYGLGALVVGAAAAAASKAGLWQALGKFLWIGLLAIGAFFVGIFRKFFGKT